LLLLISLSQALSSVQIRLLIRLDLKDYTPDKVSMISGVLRVGFARTICAFLMESQTVSLEPCDKYGFARGDPTT